MAQTLTPQEVHELLLRQNLDYFCLQVLGVRYGTIKSLLYPTPPYRAFLLSKRSGGHRMIFEPRRRLKELQKRILHFMERKSSPKPCVHGFVPKRSIVTNARQHLGSKTHHLLNLDLSDFFPTISFYRVRGVFRKEPFLLSHEIATVVAHLCTYRGSLPQGAPTSPMISNLVCRSLDRDLINLAKRHRSTYTRYADDLTFSFSVRDSTRLPASICSLEGGSAILGREIRSIIEDKHHFFVNDAKTRISTRNGRLEVTGVKINEFPNVRREFVDSIRGAIHAWEEYGYAKLQSEWRSRVLVGTAKPLIERAWARQTRTGEVPEIKRVLWGRLLYVRMVRGADDALYTRLAERFNRLVQGERQGGVLFECPTLPVERIVRNAADAELAVFVVEWAGDYLPSGAMKAEAVMGQGTAFAYRDANHLITCDHVLRWRGQIDKKDVEVDFQDPAVTLHAMSIINPSSGVNVPVTVMAREAARDLAVLQVSGVSPVQRHFAGLGSSLHRNQAGHLIGYPNWSPGRTANQVSARVLNRYSRSGLDRFEVSASIRQGNSGGPFVDGLFRVAGIAQQGATQQAGNDECLCVTELDRWVTALKW